MGIEPMIACRTSVIFWCFQASRGELTRMPFEKLAKIMPVLEAQHCKLADALTTDLLGNLW